ncbi:hypothetical protein ACJX0J_020031, partial [Zea mays]
VDAAIWLQSFMATCLLNCFYFALGSLHGTKYKYVSILWLIELIKMQSKVYGSDCQNSVGNRRKGYMIVSSESSTELSCSYISLDSETTKERAKNLETIRERDKK